MKSSEVTVRSRSPEAALRLAGDLSPGLSENSQFDGLKSRPWPAKHDLLGIHISSTTYEEAVDAILQAAELREPAIVSLHAVHALVTASRDTGLRAAVNQFDMIAPDGQPVRWALNRLYGTKLADRVYGPELMLLSLIHI